MAVAAPRGPMPRWPRPRMACCEEVARKPPRLVFQRATAFAAAYSSPDRGKSNAEFWSLPSSGCLRDSESAEFVDPRGGRFVTLISRRSFIAFLAAALAQVRGWAQGLPRVDWAWVGGCTAEGVTIKAHARPGATLQLL